MTKKKTLDEKVANDVPLVELSDDDLWRRAEVQTRLLQVMLSPAHRRKDEGPVSYWFTLGLTVGRIESLTRELAERFAAEDGADFKGQGTSI